jgi:manganese/zinc/iron transport system substrate-binding protein
MNRTVCFFLLCFPLAAGCRGANDNKGTPSGKTVEVKHPYKGAYPIKVVCTTGMVADLVRNIGKDRVQIEQIMGSDVDPHLYRANSADMEKLNQADIIFYSGLHLEGKMGEILDQLGKKIPSFGVGEYLDHAKVLSEGETHDPHIWFDVQLWSEAGGFVRDALVLFDPPHADEYKARADAYQKELAALHEEVKIKIATIPKANRVMITSHDAFRYFGRAYDIEVHGVQGISTEAEASLKDVEKLVSLIVERNVKAVFVESSVNPRNVQSIIEGCQARGHKVAPGGQLFSDAMGADGTPEGTYPGMVRHNTETIVKALR